MFDKLDLKSIDNCKKKLLRQEKKQFANHSKDVKYIKLNMFNKLDLKSINN